MPVLDEVKDLLSRLRPRAVCDDCIARELNLSVRQHANHKTRELERLRGYDRRVGECSICKNTTKKVIRRI